MEEGVPSVQAPCFPSFGLGVRLPLPPVQGPLSVPYASRSSLG